jgi:hypothetical protein
VPAATATGAATAAATGACSLLADDPNAWEHSPSPRCVWWSSDTGTNGSSSSSGRGDGSCMHHSNQQWCQVIASAAAATVPTAAPSATGCCSNTAPRQVAVCDCCSKLLTGIAIGSSSNISAAVKHSKRQQEQPCANAAAAAVYCPGCGIAIWCSSCAATETVRHQASGTCRWVPEACLLSKPVASCSFCKRVCLYSCVACTSSPYQM